MSDATASRTRGARLSNGTKVSIVIAALLFVWGIWYLFAPIYVTTTGGQQYCGSVLYGPTSEWDKKWCPATGGAGNLSKAIGLLISGVVVYSLGLLLFRVPAARLAHRSLEQTGSASVARNPASESLTETTTIYPESALGSTATRTGPTLPDDDLITPLAAGSSPNDRSDIER